MITPIDLDEAALAAAMAELGTKTKKDTVNEALRIVACRQQHAQELLDNALLRIGAGSDVTDPEIMARARR